MQATTGQRPYGTGFDSQASLDSTAKDSTTNLAGDSMSSFYSEVRRSRWRRLYSLLPP